MSILAPVCWVFVVRYVFCLLLWVYSLTVLGGLLAFLMVCSIIGDFPLSDVLAFLPGGSPILVPWYLCFLGGFVVGALDVF